MHAHEGAGSDSKNVERQRHVRVTPSRSSLARHSSPSLESSLPPSLIDVDRFAGLYTYRQGWQLHWPKVTSAALLV